MNDNKDTAAQPLDLDKLEALARAATPQDFDSAQTKREGGWAECPTCGGDGSVTLGNDYCNYDMAAQGVQFYGVGDVHVKAEAYYRAANPATVLALIALARRAPAPVVDERALFEATIPSIHPRDRNMPDHSYNSPYLHIAWEVWQLARAESPAPVVAHDAPEAPASAQPDRGAAQDDNGFRKALEEIAAMRGKGDCASDLIDIADSALAGLYATSPASQPVAPVGKEDSDE